MEEQETLCTQTRFIPLRVQTVFINAKVQRGDICYGSMISGQNSQQGDGLNLPREGAYNIEIRILGPYV